MSLLGQPSGGFVFVLKLLFGLLGWGSGCLLLWIFEGAKTCGGGLKGDWKGDLGDYVSRGFRNGWELKGALIGKEHMSADIARRVGHLREDRG